MTHVLFRSTRSDPLQVGGWWPLQDSERGRSAVVRCPVCKECATLTAHEISEDGIVSPSLQCPHNDCTFHEFVRLEGWEAT